MCGFGRLRRPLCVWVFRVLEGGNALAHSFSRGFPTQATYSFRPKITKKHFFSQTSNRLYSISFVKTSAPGGLPSSRTAVLADFLKKHPTNSSILISTTFVRDGSPPVVWDGRFDRFLEKTCSKTPKTHTTHAPDYI